MKHALTLASLVLVAGTAFGCGGNSGDDKTAASGPPTDATETEFCAGFTQIATDLAKLSADAKDADIVTAIKGAGDTLAKNGTPDSISDDARSGFELEIKQIADLPDTATKEDVQALDTNLSAAEQKQVDAFDTYVSDTCQPAAPSGSPTESPTPSQ